MTEFNSNDDEQFITQLIAGDQTSLTRLVREYHLPMKRLAASIIGEGQAEEVVQDAWLAVMRALPGFQRRSSIKTWLLTIVANEAKARLRKSKKEVFIDDLAGADNLFDKGRFVQNGHWAEAPAVWHDNSPEALFNLDIFRHCLDKTLHKLPDLQRSVLTMRDYQGMELDDICNILEISASNIRVLIHRARLQVYAMVEHFEETGEC